MLIFINSPFPLSVVPTGALIKSSILQKQINYTGIEVRGILREMDLTKVPEFSSPEAIAVTMKKMKDRGLVFVDLGSSCALHFAKGEERNKNLDEGKTIYQSGQPVQLSLHTGISQSTSQRQGQAGDR